MQAKIIMFDIKNIAFAGAFAYISHRAENTLKVKEMKLQTLTNCFKNAENP